MTTAGFVGRVAGSPRDCTNDNTKGISGYGDGGANGALFDQPDRPVEDPEGNIWVADQKGCALRKITRQGEVSTVIGRDVLCNDTVAPEDRPLLDELTWDAAHGELVAGGSRTVVLPVRLRQRRRADSPDRSEGSGHDLGVLTMVVQRLAASG